MKPYDYYLYLESILTKIKKLVDLNSKIIPVSLGNEWKKLPYLDPETSNTKAQYELILKYAERLRSREGVVAISPGFKSTYFCSFLKEAYKREMAGQINSGNDGFFDIIFAYEHGIVAMSYSHNENPVGHDGLSDRLGIPPGDIREQYIVGGGVKFDGKKLITSELSGHYGHLWTNELRQAICHVLSAATGLDVEHIVRNKTITFSSEKPVEKRHLQPYVAKNVSSFFNPVTIKSDSSSAITRDNDQSTTKCVLL